MKGFQYIYCDESCHLPLDGAKSMILGAVTCPSDKSREVALRLKDIKRRHNKNLSSEIKWSKVAPSNFEFYLDIVDYFFDDDDLGFRSVVATNKDKLEHEKYNQTHNDWYFKIYYQLLYRMLEPEKIYRIFIDIKDTNSQNKLEKLLQVLRNSTVEFKTSEIVDKLQFVRSHDTPCLQIADILIGAISSHARNSVTNEGKKKIIDRIKVRARLSLDRSTLPMEKKFNIFFWTPQTNN